ncbi:MAG: transpeptidase family protein [Deltaproteobacteria bacterium]|nr:transpeptidase family protein [Deltaproteobacteria bacterium]
MNRFVHAGPRRLNLRFQFVKAMMTLGVALLLLRCFVLQVVEGDRFRKQALRQHEGMVTIYPPRATLTDREGNPLAFSLETQSAFVHPREVQNPQKLAKDLSSFLSVDYRAILKKLNSDKPFVWLERRLPEPIAEQIQIRNLPAVGFVREHRRYYPKRDLAGHLLGFAGIDSQGLEGIELRYDEWIRGEPQQMAVERDALGRRLELRPVSLEPTQLPKEIRLTINQSIQYIAEVELEKAVKSTDAKGGVVIAMDPWSGEILAMAVQPSFNPNIFWEYRPEQWRNRAVADAYEPGSTFKVFLVAAALEAGVVQPEGTLFCENGKYRVGGRTIHDVHPHGWLTVPEVLKLSSNICVTKISQMLGRNLWHQSIRRFGFGGLTGIDLPFEASGIVRPVEQWHAIDEATTAFGQGVSTSPIQLVRAMAAIANGGNLMRPYVVREIRDHEGKLLVENEPQVSGKAISDHTAAEMRKMLQEVVVSGGTGVAARIEGYAVAGKTGTAQKVDPKTKRYSQEDYVSSFIGFLPAEDPRIVLLVLVDEPHGVHYGGTVAAPVFKRIAEQAIVHLNLPPVQDFLHSPSSLVTVTGPEAVSKPDPEEGGLEGVPNLAGMSLREVLNRFQGTGLQVRSKGNGFVVGQDPPPGSLLEGLKEIRVELATQMQTQ